MPGTLWLTDKGEAQIDRIETKGDKKSLDLCILKTLDEQGDIASVEDLVNCCDLVMTDQGKAHERIGQMIRRGWISTAPDSMKGKNVIVTDSPVSVREEVREEPEERGFIPSHPLIDSFNHVRSPLP